MADISISDKVCAKIDGVRNADTGLYSFVEMFVIHFNIVILSNYQLYFIFIYEHLMLPIIVILLDCNIKEKGAYNFFPCNSASFG